VAVAFGAGSSGTALVSGAGSLLRVRNGAAANAGLAVGFGGEGSLEVREGGAVELDTGSATGGLTLGNDAGSEGTVLVHGAGSRLTMTGAGAGFSVGNQGTGTMTLDAGASARFAIGSVGLGSGGVGTLLVRDGAELVVEGPHADFPPGGGVTVGLDGTGTLRVEDATVVLSAEGPHGFTLGTNAGALGRLELDGAAAELSIPGAEGGAIVGGGGTGELALANGAQLLVEDGVLGGITVGGSAGGAGGVELDGAGTLLDAGAAVLLATGLGAGPFGTGSARVGAGAELRAANVWLGPDGTLGGAGTVAGIVGSSGTLAPGDSVGTLAVTGDVTQAGVLAVELGGLGAGEVDLLAVDGALDLSGAVELALVGGFLPEVGDEAVVASATGALTLAPTLATSYAGAAPGFAFELVAVGGELVFRALSSAEGFGACQVSQLKAFSKLCRARLGCHAAFAKKGAKDPAGEKRDACLAKSEASFAKAYDKALAAAAKRGEACGLDAAAAEAGDAVAAPADAVAADVLAGFTPGTSRDDDALRGAFLGEAGALCGALLAADAKQAKKPDAEKRAAARARAHGRFATKTAKALDAAGSAGAAYPGPTAAEVGDAVAALAGDATSRTAGVE
jgi:T5SS/PEP-CTERM-associated repeat protein